MTETPTPEPADPPDLEPLARQAIADLDRLTASMESLKKAMIHPGSKYKEKAADPHASPCFCRHQITPKTSRYTRCSMSMLPNVSINRRIRSSGQLGRWWYSISPCRNNECVRRFTVFAFNQRS